MLKLALIRTVWRHMDLPMWNQSQHVYFTGRFCVNDLCCLVSVLLLSLSCILLWGGKFHITVELQFILYVKGKLQRFTVTNFILYMHVLLCFMQLRKQGYRLCFFVYHPWALYSCVWLKESVLLHNFLFHCGNYVCCMCVEHNIPFCCYAYHFIYKCCVFNYICTLHVHITCLVLFRTQWELNTESAMP